MKLRMLTGPERRQRGCEYCEDSYKGWMCPYNVCPYRQTDGFETYQAYLKATDTGSVAQILKKMRV